MPEPWSSEPEDQLEVAAAEWLILRPAGAPVTPAMKLVEDALEAAYQRRRKEAACS